MRDNGNFSTHQKHKRTNDNMRTKLLAQQLLLLFVRLAPSVACFVESHFDTDFWHALNRSFYKYVKMLRLRMVVGVWLRYKRIDVLRILDVWSASQHTLNTQIDWMTVACNTHMHWAKQIIHKYTNTMNTHTLAVDCDYELTERCCWCRCVRALSFIDSTNSWFFQDYGRSIEWMWRRRQLKQKTQANNSFRCRLLSSFRLHHLEWKSVKRNEYTHFTQSKEHYSFCH